jgi:hypothetical protein
LKQILGKLLTIIITSRKFSINSPYDTDRVNLLYILCDDDGIFINLTVPDGRDLCVLVAEWNIGSYLFSIIWVYLTVGNPWVLV